jgi:hypothetical protein
MGQHSQSTQVEPSRASIVSGWILVTAVTALMTRVVSAFMMTEAHLIALALGLGLNVILVAQTVSRMGERSLSRDRVRREEEKIQRAAQRVREECQRNTGTWEGDEPGQVLTVRWDPAARIYLVRGWLGDFWQASNETPWPDLETLAAALAEFERTQELIPWDDEGTCSVRTWLGLPGWDTGTMDVAEEPLDTPEFVTAEEWQEAYEARQRVGEDTAVIQLSSRMRVPPGLYWDEELRTVDTTV